GGLGWPDQEPSASVAHDQPVAAPCLLEHLRRLAAIATATRALDDRHDRATVLRGADALVAGANPRGEPAHEGRPLGFDPGGLLALAGLFGREHGEAAGGLGFDCGDR